MNSTLKPVAALVRSLPADQGFALIPNAKLFEIYALTVYARQLNERLLKLARKSSHFAQVADAAGQEALLAATLVDLGRGDTLAPGAQALVPCGLKGIPADALASLFAATRKTVPWARHRVVSATLSLEEQLEQTLAAAADARKEEKKRITVALVGDPEPNAKLLLKALKRAKQEKLPILFVASSPAEKPEFIQTAAKLETPSAIVDVADALAIYRVVTESAAHARRGNGPTLIECRPWLLTDTPADPIELLEQAMRRRKIFSASLRNRTNAAFRKALGGR
jgi:TPP-dependent pyruvate/acetoin dehydrogenase alpha subunit